MIKEFSNKELIYCLLCVYFVVFAVYESIISIKHYRMSSMLNNTFVKYKHNRTAVVKHVHYKGRKNIELILFDYGLTSQIKCTLDDLEF